MATITESVGREAHPQKVIANPREQLLKRIRGSHVTIPDLQSMISHWPQGVYPEVERLDDYVQETLTNTLSLSNDNTRLRKLKASNIALFGASWWPFASSYEALEIVTCLALWLFAWDDETDSAEFSSIIRDWDKASTFRQRTIDYLRASLSGSPESKLAEISTEPIIAVFKPVGGAIYKSCNDRQINTLLDELIFYLNMCGEEQKLQVAHRLPTIEEYVRFRMGSGAVRVCFATIEYAYGLTLPDEVMADEDMQQIWHEANVIIYTTNDILSMKKEIAQSQVDSLVPLLTLQLGSVQGAMDHAVDMVRTSVRRLDAAEAQILRRYASTPKVQEDILKFIDGCKYACTSNLNWRYVTYYP
ncbi:terpenoid synthase [Hypoxylon trugodes]|uniref:terpenoid synthase n=1 Tax=Hypoxylon trugodes TaxID=326681 RepID=UPI0021948006|nr:terpenoid synthase [Hypoxylon trugodes]KAI1389854.1 terpenoid synthase [Hypoxylon trugodes]